MYNADIVTIGTSAVLTCEFSKYRVHIIAVDKRDDVGGYVSKLNSSVISRDADGCRIL